LKRQRHGEAAGVGRGDQLFRIGALLILETGFEGIRGVGEHAGIGGQMTVAGASGAAPNRSRLADHVTSPLPLDQRFTKSKILIFRMVRLGSRRFRVFEMSPLCKGFLSSMRVRRETAEHPFGTLKMWMGATHFPMKRLPKVATEMALHVRAYNLTRVMNIIG